jgi:type IX secretion system PorP/SprF family membrane protein
MRKIGLIFLSVLLVLLADSLFAQSEVVFSQYMNAPLQINPANAGLFNGRVRLLGNYKRQWESIDNPFQTIAASADMQVARELSPGDFLGLGFDLLQDKGGAGGFQSTNVNLTLSYTKTMDPYDEHFVSLGLQVGYGQRSIALSALRWGNQWADIGFDPTLPSQEQFVDEAINFLDISGGVNYIFNNQKNIKLSLGVASYHLNEPSYSFLDADNVLNQRLVVNGMLRLQMSDPKFVLVPSFVYFTQQNMTSIKYGIDFEYVFNAGSRFTGMVQPTSLALGVYQIFSNGITPMLRIQKSGFLLAISYDINIGSVSRINEGLGGPEFTVGYRIGSMNGRNDKNVTNSFF